MCAVIALAASLVAWTMAHRPLVTQDFAFPFSGTQRWLGGVNPYALEPYTAAWPLYDYELYPVTAFLFLAPLATLSQAAAVAIFVGIPSALLAWHLTKDGLWPLLALASPGYAMAVVLGQWAPWMMVAMLMPAFGFLFPCKPSLGAACFLWRPSWRAFLIGLAFVVLSLLVWPMWPFDWLANLHKLTGHPSPLFTIAGGWLWIAAVRWYRDDGRLVLAQAAVPQVLFFADQAPLLLIARTKGEALTLLACGWIAAICWHVRHYHTANFLQSAEPYVLVGCYLPALWLVLRRRA